VRGPFCLRFPRACNRFNKHQVRHCHSSGRFDGGPHLSASYRTIGPLQKTNPRGEVAYTQRRASATALSSFMMGWSTCLWRIPNYVEIEGFCALLKSGMRDLILLLVHVVTTVMRVYQPGRVRAVIAESVLTKHQLLILNRPRRRAESPHPGSPDCWILFAVD
jgi:hypothetical protein